MRLRVRPPLRARVYTVGEPVFRKMLLVILLVTLVGSAALWVRSHWWSTYFVSEMRCVNHSYQCWVSLRHGVLTTTFFHHGLPICAIARKGIYWEASSTPEQPSVDTILRSFVRWRWQWQTGKNIFIEIPMWLPTVVLSLYLYIMIRRIARTHSRRRQNHCLNCGYNLQGNVSGRCSECGTAVSSKT